MTAGKVRREVCVCDEEEGRISGLECVGVSWCFSVSVDVFAREREEACGVCAGSSGMRDEWKTEDGKEGGV
jgi:hypothetical protein